MPANSEAFQLAKEIHDLHETLIGAPDHPGICEQLRNCRIDINNHTAYIKECEARLAIIETERAVSAGEKNNTASGWTRFFAWAAVVGPFAMLLIGHYWK